jgi:hypothetical protein
MPGAVVAVIFGVVMGDDPITHARPALVPHGDTTRLIADSSTAASHPTHIATGNYRIDTVCDGTYCVEELRAGRHVLIAAAQAIAALQHQVSDPGEEDKVDATEVVLPQVSAPGFLSVTRMESDYYEGAAHANGSARCETYSLASGRRQTLREVVGARAARKIAAAAGHGTRTTTTNLLVPAPGVVFVCDPELPDHTPVMTPIVVHLR